MPFAVATSSNQNVDIGDLMKPICEKPKLSDDLKEELRSRLLFVKSALQKSQPDYEH